MSGGAIRYDRWEDIPPQIRDRIPPEQAARIKGAQLPAGEESRAVRIAQEGCAWASRWHMVVPVRIQRGGNNREHWAERQARVAAEKAAVRQVLPPMLYRPRLPVVVTMTRVAPVALDDDNCTAGFKAVRDELARWLGIDDADKRVAWICDQRQSDVYQAEVLIESVAVVGGADA